MATTKGINDDGQPVLAMHGVPLIQGGLAQRRLSIKLTYGKGASGARITIFVYDRSARRTLGNGVAITLDKDNSGEVLAAQGTAYRMRCWFAGPLHSYVKLSVTYPADMHIDEPAAQLSSDDTEITEPNLGFNDVRFLVPSEGVLK